MPFIQNRSYAGQKLLIGSEIVELDADGIGTIKSQEMADAVVQSVAGFSSVDADAPVAESEPVKEPDPEVVESPSLEDQIAASLAEDGFSTNEIAKAVPTRATKLRTSKKA